MAQSQNDVDYSVTLTSEADDDSVADKLNTAASFGVKPTAPLDLRAVIDGMSEGFALLDSEFTILELNAEAMRLDERNRDAVIGRTHWDAFPGTEFSELGLLYKKAIHDRVSVMLEHRHVWEDGHATWLDMRAYPVGDDQLAIFYRDVTERHEAEERFRDLAENIGAVFYVHELERRRISYVSPAYERIWQSSTAALYADPTAFLQPIHPDDRAAVEAGLQRQVNGQNTATRYRLVLADGSIRYIYDRAFHAGAPNEGNQRVVGIAEDVTETTEARLQLARNAETFQTLVRDSPFGIYVVDDGFRLRHVSQGCQRIFAGISPLIDRDFAEILHEVWNEKFAAELIARFRHTLAMGKPFVSHRTVEPRGNIATVEAYDWRIDRLVLPNGQYGVVCYFYDLSERVELEESLRRAVTNKDLLAREIDHRIRNSLSLVSALLSMQGGTSPIPEVKHALSVAASRMQAVARIHESLYKGELVGIIQFDEYLTQICNDLETSLASEGVHLEIDAVPLQISVDHAVPLGLAANELVTNAFKHSRADGIIIRVGLAVTTGGYALTVTDDGAGMPDDFVAGRGTGLGMTVVDLLARQIGGSIAFPASGEAAHFNIFIPQQIVIVDRNRATCRPPK